MKFPALFRKDSTHLAAPDAQDRAEKLLADSFRLLGQVCGKVADLIETQRLQRSGYEKQERFLERLDKDAPKPDAK